MHLGQLLIKAAPVETNQRDDDDLGGGTVLIASSITCCPSNTFPSSISAHVILVIEGPKHETRAEQTFAALGQMILSEGSYISRAAKEQQASTSYRSFTFPATDCSTSSVNVATPEQLLLRLVSFNHAFVVAEWALFQPLQISFFDFLLLLHLFQMPYCQINTEPGP